MMRKDSNVNAHRFYWSLFVLLCLSFNSVRSLHHAEAGSTVQEQSTFSAIDAYIAEQLNHLDIPGLAVGIVQEGQIAHLGGFGAADSSGRQVNPQTPFYIGSVTKSFTALAVMQLAEAGKIDLDAPVRFYLPWFELADKEASANMTVRNLLNQSSGISTKDGNSLWSSQQGLEETVRGFNTVQLAQPVGTTYQYSNLNFMIAGLIVEEVSGQSYADYVTRHIFEPLDMRHSYATRTAALADGLATEHYYMLGRVFELKGPKPPANLPAGALIASAEDLSHYMIAQLNEGQFSGQYVLSPEGIAEMHAPAIPRGADDSYYAMGWHVGSVDGVPTVWHSGDDGRSHAIIILRPETNSGVVLLANASGFEQRSQVDDIALNVLSMLGGATPVAVSLPLLFRLLYWSVLLTPFLMILGIALVWRNGRRARPRQILFISGLYVTIVFLILRFALIEITLRSMLVFHPELGYGLISIGAIGIGWSIIFPATHIYLRRAH